MDLESLITEVREYVKYLDVSEEGERLWHKYEEVTAYLVRLQEIHNEIALMEIYGTASTELKKFRTLIVDPTIERFDKVAVFQSRKITAKQIEKDLERG